MKNLLLSYLLLFATGSFASKTDSLFQRHQINFSITNAMSLAPEIWVDFGPTNNDATPYYPYDRHIGNGPAINTLHSTIIIPNYTLHLKFEYSLGISNIVRLETGVGYLVQGLTIKYSLPDKSFPSSSLTYCYIGALTIPLHFKLYKKKHQSNWTYTFGPNVTFPFHDVYKTINVVDAGIKRPSRTGNQLFNSFADNSSLGFDLKIGYEKQLNKHITVNFGPVISFSQIYWLYAQKMATEAQIPQSYFQTYIGIDVALNFGLKSK